MTGPRAVVVTTLRNEGAFLLEWVAHHRALGFAGILAYSNDCEDGTDAMLDRLAAMGGLAHRRNPGPHPRGPQWAALRAADRDPVAQEADWVLVADIDEFPVVHAGEGRLDDLLAAVPGADAIALTWRMFGNDGQAAFRDAPVTETFLRCAPAVLHWPWRAQMIKTLFRRDGAYARLGVHRPRDPAPGAAPRWVDGSGEPLPDAFRAARLFTDPGRDPHRLAQMNHYALGSAEAFVVKCDRGRANRAAPAFDLGYWADRNFSAVEDRSILRLAPARRAIEAELRADPVLGALHRAAVDWRRARFRALMREEPWRALYGQLRMLPPSRVLDRDEAQAILRAQVG